MNPSASLILTVFSVLAFGAGFCQAASCFPKFKSSSTLENAGKNCAKALIAQGVTNMTFPNPGDLEKNQWNDNCLANCTMVELKVIVNNTFNKDALLALLKQSAPAEALAKLTKIVEECEAISFKHDDDHEGKNDKKASVVQGKEDKKEKAGNKRETGKMEKAAPAKDTNKMGKPANAMNPENKNKMMSSDTKSSHSHSHEKMICKQAAKFTSCYQKREQQVC